MCCVYRMAEQGQQPSNDLLVDEIILCQQHAQFGLLSDVQQRCSPSLDLGLGRELRVCQRTGQRNLHGAAGQGSLAQLARDDDFPVHQARELLRNRQTESGAT